MKLKEFFTTTRIAGLIFLAIAILFYYKSAYFTDYLMPFIVSLALLLTSNDYAKKCFKALQNSLTPGKNFFLVLLFEAIFWLLSIGAVSTAVITLRNFGIKNIKPLADALPEIQTKSQQAMAEYGTAITNYYTLSGTLIILLFVLIITFYSIANFASLNTVFKKNYGKREFIQYLKLNIGWFIFWTIIYLTAILVMAPTLQSELVTLTKLLSTAVFFVLVFLTIHTTLVLQNTFFKQLNTKQSLLKTFDIGILSIHKFILPYAQAIVLYFIIMSLFKLLIINLPKIFPIDLSTLASFLVLILATAWFKYYFRDIV